LGAGGEIQLTDVLKELDQREAIYMSITLKVKDMM
jgi:UTP-glucose-1-phosphate uridylyltransferase